MAAAAGADAAAEALCRLVALYCCITAAKTHGITNLVSSVQCSPQDNL